VITSLLILLGTLVALVLALLLWALAALHAYWGNGGLWPEDNELSLARRVVGAPDIRTMPSPTASYIVAGALFFAGLWPLVTVGVLPPIIPGELLILAGYGLMLVFLGRGIAAYTDAFRRLFPEEPFATLDRQLYGPLCLLIGIGFAFLISLGWITP
jgi:hypothetical protein